MNLTLYVQQENFVQYTLKNCPINKKLDFDVKRTWWQMYYIEITWYLCTWENGGVDVCEGGKNRIPNKFEEYTDSQTVWQHALMGDNTGKSSILACWFTSGLLDSESMNESCEYRNRNIEVKFAH